MVAVRRPATATGAFARGFSVATNRVYATPSPTTDQQTIGIAMMGETVAIITMTPISVANKACPNR